MAETAVKINSKSNEFEGVRLEKKLVLGIQHVLAMFGATVLVPLLTGLNPAVALFAAGCGTLLFHFVTKNKVPVFLGSSFAFIPVIQMVDKAYGGLEYAQGGIVVAGLLYVILSAIVKIFGADTIKSFLPPVVTGPMIIVIGLNLSPVAIRMAASHWGVAVIVVLTVMAVSIFAKGFFKLLPILSGVVVGYIAASFLGLVDVSAIQQASVIQMPQFTFPKFNLGAIALIAPIVAVVFMEHVGDITTNGAVVGKDFFKDPGLHRTLLGDGLATLLAGMIGGPANTTYGENTGVLAVTKVYDPSILRIAACIAIGLSFIGKFGAMIQTIPTAVMGGISLILFGMIASIGMRTVAEGNIDFTDNRNLIIASLILVLGIGTTVVTDVPVGITITENAKLTGLSLAAIVGIVSNKLLPVQK
ncbi:MAG: uracil permease [Anaerosolibacter sp.]|jgi:uracil permease|uniref:uracil-xanthine permease family protein n=1 Tax=Anaerosolibacter sp. TaxID=1872527 RepID=UPI00261F6F48|nr:uracil-xanthine permease family protein [Anaerosolibacter sp.]MDF2546851.1 uracil permease [Anaerosolibacter sp.]